MFRKDTNAITPRRFLAALVAVSTVAASCGSDDTTSSDAAAADTAAPAAPADDGAADDGAASGGDTYEVFALLPQGNDQPYGTTYLPPFEAKAAELGLNVNITNSQYDADKQASEC